jgi:hypothetical protein
MTPFEEGQQAASDGLEDNPHPPFTLAYNDWEEGRRTQWGAIQSGENWQEIADNE